MSDEVYGRILEDLTLPGDRTGEPTLIGRQARVIAFVEATELWEPLVGVWTWTARAAEWWWPVDLVYTHGATLRSERARACFPELDLDHYRAD